MTIILTDIEMELAALVGIRRRTESKAKGRADNHGYNGTRAWDIDIEGAAAELAYCKARGKYWGGTLNGFKDADQGERVQIRHSALPEASLIVRPEDNPDHYYVLVTGSAPVFTLVGWMLGADATDQRFWKEPNGRPGAFFVPQSELHRF